MQGGTRQDGDKNCDTSFVVCAYVLPTEAVKKSFAPFLPSPGHRRFPRERERERERGRGKNFCIKVLSRRGGKGREMIEGGRKEGNSQSSTCSTRIDTSEKMIGT